jgi:hypothetical protein
MKISAFLAASLLSFSAAVNAASVEQRVFTTPKRLIELSPSQQQWMSDEEIDGLIRNHVGFMDVTDHQDLADGADFVKNSVTGTLLH